MKFASKICLVAALSCSIAVNAQEVRTIFKSPLRSTGGYGAVVNKTSFIRDKYVNLSGLYGGWFINKKVMVGLGFAASTSNLKVPADFSADPTRSLTWQYGQFGLMSEYVIGSNKPVHVVLQGFAGAGFSLQYSRNNFHVEPDPAMDENWFVVAEPGVQVEFNLFKWARFSPGISYRRTFGSDARGLRDTDLSGVSYNATLKFGKF